MMLENKSEAPWEAFDPRPADQIDKDTKYDKEVKEIILDELQRDHIAVVFLTDGRIFEVFADDLDERCVMRSRGSTVAIPVGKPGENFHLFFTPLLPGKEFALLEHEEPKPIIAQLATRLKTRAIQAINKNTIMDLSDE